MAVLQCACLAVLVAWFNGSRAALILSFSMLLLALDKKKAVNIIFALLFFIWNYCFVFSSRGIFDKNSYEAFFMASIDAFSSSWELTSNTIGYITAFSIYHFATTITSNNDNFGVLDLIYSLTPIPSYLMPYKPDVSDWRLDVFRPLGGVYELFSVSPVSFLVFFFFLGFLFATADIVVLGKKKMLFLLLSLFIVVFLFQYNLRGVQWFLYAYAFLVIILKEKK
ncbi:hypothetical protein [Vibrio cincinnatiensis]